MAGQALEEVGFDFTSVGGLSLTDTSCVDDWLNGYVIDSVMKVSVHTIMKFHSVTGDIQKTLVCFKYIKRIF